MAPIKKSLPELIGHTPLLELSRYRQTQDLKAEIIAKIESFNPGGSVKDRVASAMIEDAEMRGLIGPGATIIEPTSGNTGIGLAAVAASRGYHVILCMPETMSIERRQLMQAYGAEIVLTPAALGMRGAIDQAEQLHQNTPNSFIPRQFDNPANPSIHQHTTGPEIFEDCNGQLDYFIAGVGTGGTISGVGRYLKSQNPSIQVIAVEPASSAVLSGGQAGPHGLQGIGAGFVPANYDGEIVDEIIPVEDNEAFTACRALAKSEGLLVGISSGAALHAAQIIAQRPACWGKRIVVLFPDTGERYLSTSLFTD